jgi:hypothetical protein
MAVIESNKKVRVDWSELFAIDLKKAQSFLILFAYFLGFSLFPFHTYRGKKMAICTSSLSSQKFFTTQPLPYFCSSVCSYVAQ